MTLIKKLTTDGQKDFQRGTDSEDRELQYKKWLRTFRVDGFFSDVDMFKWKKDEEGNLKIVAITDLTRTDSEEVNQHYLDSIYYRIFNRDSQGRNLEAIGKLLSAPVFLVLFPKSCNWMQVLHFSDKIWRKYTASEWAEYLKTL